MYPEGSKPQRYPVCLFLVSRKERGHELLRGTTAVNKTYGLILVMGYPVIGKLFFLWTSGVSHVNPCKLPIRDRQLQQRKQENYRYQASHTSYVDRCRKYIEAVRANN